MALAFTGSGSLTLTNKYEIIMPINTKRTTVDLVQRTDNNVWNQGIKIAGNIADNLIIEITLALRIHRSLMGSLITFLEANYNSQVVVVTADGYDLFDDDNRGSANNCVINNFNNPIRELTNWYRIDINLVKL